MLGVGDDEAPVDETADDDEPEPPRLHYPNELARRVAQSLGLRVHRSPSKR